MRLAEADVVVCVEGFFEMGGTERQAVNIAVGLRSRGTAVALLSRWPLSTENVYVKELLAAGVPVIARGWVGRGTSPVDRLGVYMAKLRAAGRERSLVASAWAWQRRQLEKGAKRRPVLHEIPFFGRVPPEGRRVLTALALPVVHSTFGSPSEGPPAPATRGAVLTSDGSSCADERFRFIPTMAATVVDGSLASSTETLPHAFFAGRMVRSKGVEVLIEAAALVPGLRLRLAGQGSAVEDLMSLAARKRVPAEFLGRLSPARLAAEFARCHVTVVPSLPTELGEGVPTVVGESLAAGTPVVASAVGGTPYLDRLIGDREILKLVVPGRVEDLAHALSSAIDGWHTSLSTRAREAHTRFLSPEAILPQYEDCYSEARAQQPALTASTDYKQV